MKEAEPFIGFYRKVQNGTEPEVWYRCSINGCQWGISHSHKGPWFNIDLNLIPKEVVEECIKEFDDEANLAVAHI